MLIHGIGLSNLNALFDILLTKPGIFPENI